MRRLTRGGGRYVLVALVALVVLAIFRAPLERAFVAATIDALTGDLIAFDGLDLSSRRIVATGVWVARGGAPLFDARRIDVRYDLHAVVFGGGERRYGLTRVDLDGSRLWLVRRSDGSFDLAARRGGSQPGPPSTATPRTPLRFALAVRDGRIALIDPGRALAGSRNLALENVALRANVDDATATTYRGTARVAGGARAPLAFAGRIDADGYAEHRLHAARVPLAPIANYFINTRSAELLRGEATDVDVRAYAFPAAGGDDGGYHLSGVAHVRGGAMHVPGLAVDATDMRGTIGAFDGGIVAPRLDARLGAIAVVLAGGVYGWHAPAFRLGVRASADLGAARGLFRFSRRLPLRGAATLSTLLEGAVGTPLVATRVGAAGLSYGRFPVSAAAGRAVYYAGQVDVVGARGTYGGIAVSADGSIALGAGEPVTRLVVGASGPAVDVPYAAELAPAAALHATALLAGDGIRFDARGDAEGAGGGTTLSAPFHVDPLGEGSFGPIVVRRDDGRELAGTFYLDRAHDASGFWLDARDFPFAGAGVAPRLPGIDLVAPSFAGRLDGAVAGVGPPSAFRLAGRVRARGLRVGSVAIDDVTGDVAGAFGNLRLGGVIARGPWGRFAGTGAYADGRLALAGRYAGGLEMLRAFTGDVGGTGALGAPVALLLDPRVSIVQTDGSHGPGTAVHGVPFDRLAATIAVENRRLRVYAATADVAGGRFAAGGTLASADGIGVSVTGANAARMRGAPLARGTVAAIGSVTAGRGPVRFAGGLAVSGGATAGVPLAGNGDLTFAPGDFAFERVDAEAAGAVLEARGRVRGAGAPGSVYDVALHVPSLGIGPLARAMGGGNALSGTARGDVRVTGSYERLRVDGRVEMPEGTIDGLAFANASANVSLGRDGFRARHGRVTVGSTGTAFSASYRGDDSAIRVVARHANLADFNDLFDAGDTLGGRGRVAIRFVRRGRATRTNADIAIAGLRYRRFDLGDARATWTSRGRDVVGSVLFGGPSGRLAASGTLVLPMRAALPGLLLGSRFDGRADLQGLDLGVWLPALGYQLPVSGRLDATARIAGPLRNPALTTVATLRDGSLGAFPVERFTLSASSTLERTTVRELDLELPSVTIVGSGQFGLAPRSPLALALHASSPNLGLLSARVFGASGSVTGSGSADVAVDGTRENPHVTGRVGVRDASVRGVALPQADAAFGLRGRDVVLRDTTVRFATGSVSLAGYAPLEIAPLAVGPPNAPVALEFTASDVELADFAPLLPAGSTLRGRLDGHVTVGGTAATPRVGGLLELASGALQTPYERVALTDATARLRFDGDAARLDAFHAEAGGGTLDASGSVRFADVLGFGPAAYDFVGRADKLRLDLPAYGSGSLDGTLSFTRLAGGRPAIAGDLRLSDGTIPFSALLLAGGGGGGFDAAAATGAAPGALPSLPHDVGFDLDVSAVKNVRVRSANVDIGARGDLHIAGSLDRPALSGGFTSTGGTVTYFNTVFRLVRGVVAFEPDRGVVPTLDAVATTHVIDPDPNTVRNATGSADVTLTLSGPVTSLTIGLKSDPAYERQQILGLLLNAPALGATNLFGETPGEATLYGSNSVANLPPSVAASRSTAGEVSVAQEAFGVANAQFTRTLLAPFETTLAQAVGLSNFNVNVDYTGNVGLSARKILGKNVNAIYGTSFGYPYRQTFGFEIKQNDATAAQVTVFQTLGEYGLSSQTPTTLLTSTGNPKYNAAQPSAGTAGFSLSIQHLF